MLQFRVLETPFRVLQFRVLETPFRGCCSSEYWKPIQGAAVQSTGNAIRDAAVQNTGNAIWDAAVQSAGNAIQDAAVQVTGAEVQDAQTAINGIRADIEGIIPRNILKVPAHIGTRLKHKLTTPVNIRVEVPDEIVASSRDELDRVKARAIYSDGTVSEKVVDWHTGGVNWNRPGSYQIRGTVCQDHFEFPIAVNRADPCITKWNGRYYFIATNDADGNHTLYIRKRIPFPGLSMRKRSCCSIPIHIRM